MVTLSPFIFIVYMYIVFLLLSVKDWKYFMWQVELFCVDYIVMLVCDLDAVGTLSFH